MVSAPSSNPLLLPAVSKSRRVSTDDVAMAVIGCGIHSTTAILPSLRHAPVRLIAVCDLDENRRESARRQFGAEFAYRSADDLLSRPDLDAVIVVGPPDLHVSAGIAALESGRHVFIEKPPGTSIADALRLQATSRVARKELMVGFMKRHASAYRLVKQLIAGEEFGAVTSVHLTYGHWPVDGIRFHLTDMSIHALDTVRWLQGDPIRMTAYKRPVRGNHALTLILEHTSGGVSQLDLSAFHPGLQERLVVTGEQAEVRVEGMTSLTYVRQAPGKSHYDANGRLTNTWSPEMVLPDIENDELIIQGYAAELIAFAVAIREGKGVNASIDDGVAAMGLIEAIVEAPEGLSTADLPITGAAPV